MLREETVFGPIRSRRLGVSLGINLLPSDGKVCNFDCIYCECGWNRDGAGGGPLPTAAEVRTALKSKLESLGDWCAEVDSITFSGDGEPTLNPDFPQIIDDTLALRDEFCPGASVSVLSNATRVDRQEIFRALRKVDNPIMKIDAPTTALAARINRPAPGYDVSRVVKSLEKFGGDFVLQTMFLRSELFDSSSPEVLGGWMDIVRTLKPRKVMVYTVDRPTPASCISKLSVGEMESLVKPLVGEGFDVSIYG